MYSYFIKFTCLHFKEFYILGVPQGACGPPELAKFQAVVPEYQIKVFSATSKEELLFKGPEANHIIYLILDENLKHYDVITGKILTWNIMIWFNVLILKTFTQNEQPQHWLKSEEQMSEVLYSQGIETNNS